MLPRRHARPGLPCGVPTLLSNPEQNFLEQGRDVDTFELIDNAGKSWGDHFIDFGGNYRCSSSTRSTPAARSRCDVGFNDIGTLNRSRRASSPAASAPRTSTTRPTSWRPSPVSFAPRRNLQRVQLQLRPAPRPGPAIHSATSASGLTRRHLATAPQPDPESRPAVRVPLGSEREERAARAAGRRSRFAAHEHADRGRHGRRAPLYNNDWNNFAPERQLRVGPVRRGQDLDPRRLRHLLRHRQQLTTIDNAAGAAARGR